MAQITLTVPNGNVDRIVDAFSNEVGKASSMSNDEKSALVKEGLASYMTARTKKFEINNTIDAAIETEKTNFTDIDVT